MSWILTAPTIWRRSQSPTEDRESTLPPSFPRHSMRLMFNSSAKPSPTPMRLCAPSKLTSIYEKCSHW